MGRPTVVLVEKRKPRAPPEQLTCLSSLFFAPHPKTMAIGAQKNYGATHLLLLVQLCFCFHSSFSELQRLEHGAKPDGSLSLLAIGDWGRKGRYNQSEVAVQMGRIGKELDIDFIISNGDNFYDNGLTGVEDTSFEESFTNIYTAESLQKPWYTVLGNHDYRSDALAQLSPVLRKVDSRWICMRSFVVNAEVAEFFFIDTTPLIEYYRLDSKDHKYDWRDVSPRETYMANLLKDLDSALRESSATWKVVVGHHAIRSVGYHGDTEELGKFILPILEANNVDLYINGHDHCLQHISSTSNPIQFMTTGAGSKAWRGGIVSNANRDGLQFYHDGQGFISLQLMPLDAKVVFYDVYGNPMHKWTMSKQFQFHTSM